MLIFVVVVICRHTGKIRSIGVSNFEVEDLQRLMEIARVHPSVVQNFFDPFNQDLMTRKFCEGNNIQYMAHRYSVMVMIMVFIYRIFYMHIQMRFTSK